MLYKLQHNTFTEHTKLAGAHTVASDRQLKACYLPSASWNSYRCVLIGCLNRSGGRVHVAASLFIKHSINCAVPFTTLSSGIVPNYENARPHLGYPQNTLKNYNKTFHSPQLNLTCIWSILGSLFITGLPLVVKCESLYFTSYATCMYLRVRICIS